MSPLRGSTEFTGVGHGDPWVGTHGYGYVTATRFRVEVEVATNRTGGVMPQLKSVFSEDALLDLFPNSGLLFTWVGRVWRAGGLLL